MELENKLKIYNRTFIPDNRGWFLKAMTGKESGLPTSFGEIYVVSIAPDQIRGNHFHPLCAEWFTIVEGCCQVVLSDPVDGERLELTIEAPSTLFVPAGIVHAFTPIHEKGDGRVLMLAYAEFGYDPSDTIEINILQR